jgi:glyoxylase-like metal-dependent hydrolase (beta-lactamase superfamily II)
MKLWNESDDEHNKQMFGMMQSLQDKFSFVNDRDDVVSGVCTVLIPGHTPGQAALLVESEGERLLHVADLLHQPLQFANPDWHFIWDTDGELGVESRRTQLENCANDKTLTLFYHLRFPGLGHVEKAGDAYRWLPLEG